MMTENHPLIFNIRLFWQICQIQFIVCYIYWELLSLMHMAWVIELWDFRSILPRCHVLYVVCDVVQRIHTVVIILMISLYYIHCHERWINLHNQDFWQVIQAENTEKLNSIWHETFWGEVKQCVLQVSLLGPLLFNRVVTDMFNFIERINSYNHTDSNFISVAAKNIDKSFKMIVWML